MTRVRFVVQSIFILMLAACSANVAPARFSDADFVQKVVRLDSPVPRVLQQFRQGLRLCGPSSGGVVFVTHHGVVDCLGMRADGVETCDIYAGSADGGRSGLVMGRADFVPDGIGTTVTLRLRTSFANREKIFEAWEKFLIGREREVCP